MHKLLLPFLLLIVIQGCRKDDSHSSPDKPELELLKTTQLSEPRAVGRTVVFDNKVFFIGGSGKNIQGYTTRDAVDFYDLQTETWSTYKLSIPKLVGPHFIFGNKLMLFGGYSKTDMAQMIEVYDSDTHTWSVIPMGFALGSFSVVREENKLYMSNIDSYNLDSVSFLTYDAETNQWTKGHLSNNCYGTAVVKAGKKIYFAGGFEYIQDLNRSIYRKTIDIYDIETGTWSADSLSTARAYAKGVLARDKLFFVGGKNASGNLSTIDIYDLTTKTWSIDRLSEPLSFIKTVEIGNYIYFSGWTEDLKEHRLAKVYDKSTHTWITDPLKLGSETGIMKVTDKYAVFYKDYYKEEIQNPKLEIYNIQDNSWSSITLKNKCHEPVAEIAGDKLFVAGGAVRDTDQSDYRYIEVSDVFIYKLK